MVAGLDDIQRTLAQFGTGGTAERSAVGDVQVRPAARVQTPVRILRVLRFLRILRIVLLLGRLPGQG